MKTVPIRGVLGDQQAALFGQGCFEPGAMKTTYGTGCFLLLNTGTRRVDSKAGLLTTLAVDGLGEPCFALEGSAFAGGTVVQWLRDELGIIDDAAASEELARSVPDTGGVVLVPAFAGLGAPHWDPDARAALLGLTRGSSRAHVARAALEAIAHQCADLAEALREDPAKGRMLVDGGAARNDLLLQRQADFAALRVIRPARSRRRRAGRRRWPRWGRICWTPRVSLARSRRSRGSSSRRRAGWRRSARGGATRSPGCGAAPPRWAEREETEPRSTWSTRGIPTRCGW